MLTPAASNGLMFSVVGGLATAPSMQTARQSFVQFIKEKDICVENIAREEIDKVLRESGKFPLGDDQNNAAAVVKVIVKQFRSTVVPVLYLQC